MQKLRKQKGITLIALIITIIVMLILVGVTVSVSLNGGLFEKTKQAGNEMQREVDRETLYDLVLASIGNDGKVDFEVLDGKVAAAGFTGENGTYTSAKGNTFTVGDYGQITYEGESNPVTPPDDNPPAGDSDVETVAVASFVQNGTTITGLDANGQEVATLEVGQQIAYDCYDETLTDEEKTKKLYHKATIAETGNTTEQIVGPEYETIEGADGAEPEFQVTASDESRVWNILGVDNGKLLITTDPIITSLKLAFTSVTWSEEMSVLNDICAIYGHGKYAESARSIKMTDVKKLTGVTYTFPEPEIDTSSVEDYETLRKIIPTIETTNFNNHSNYSLLEGDFFLNNFAWEYSWDYYYDESTQNGDWDRNNCPIGVGFVIRDGTITMESMLMADYSFRT